MKTTILNGNLELQKLVLQANIRFIDLKGHVRFTHMAEAQLNPYSPQSYVHEREYQRRVNETRKKDIKKYIESTIVEALNRKEEPVLFPTAMLLACTLDYLDNEASDGEYVELPDNVEFFIVDGQHRLSSMMALYEDIKGRIPYPQDKQVLNYLERFKFNCTILLNFDMWEQAKVFADVNFNQKKVDRSLYYSIYGMEFNENAPLHTNAMYAAHNLVATLNSRDNSALKDKIKMLGTGKGFVSQAFVADGLLRHINSPRGIWHSLFKQACERDDLQRRFSFMTDEALSFFKVIREVFSEQWPIDDSHRSILLKTTGIGALIRLMGFLHKKHEFDGVGVEKIDSNLKSKTVQEYEEVLRADLLPLREAGEELFSLQGPFAGTGGAGLESRLYKKLISIIEKDFHQRLILQTQIPINGISLGVKFYKDDDGLWSFVLSHYFKNSYQIDFYRPGSGSVAFSREELESKLRAYLKQVDPDAQYERNMNF